jgi:dTDP-4-dehydrorhamnose 3,5-epimerase
MASQPEFPRNFTPDHGGIEGGKKDRQSITADWEFLQQLIDKVRVKAVRNVVKENGVLTEVYRRDWALDDSGVEQVFQVMLFPGGVSAWHTHQLTTDRLFVHQGIIKVVLYDARQESPTYGRINEFRCGSVRPALIVVPPGVWHGVQNISHEPAALLNIVDRAYTYEDPDHWRLPWDTEKIPYSFSRSSISDKSSDR